MIASAASVLEQMPQPPDAHDVLQKQTAALQQALALNNELVQIFRHARGYTECNGNAGLDPIGPQAIRTSVRTESESTPLAARQQSTPLAARQQSTPLAARQQPSVVFSEEDVKSQSSSEILTGSQACYTRQTPPDFLEPLITASSGRDDTRLSSKQRGYEDEENTRLSSKHSALRGAVSSCVDSRKVSMFARAAFLPPNKGEIRKNMDKALHHAPADAEDLYKSDGCWQALARSPWFKNTILVVIILYTLWMAVDIDYNKAIILSEAPLFCQITDHLFTAVFFVEIVTRFMAYTSKATAFGDRMFVIDFVLVALMVWENWILVLVHYLFGALPFSGGSRSSSVFRMFRVFRLLRVARAARLFNSIPELLILAKAMAVAVRSVISILVLLALVIYIFALIFTQLLSGSEIASGHFDTVPKTMNFLLLAALCGPDADFIGDLLVGGWVYYVIYLLFSFLSTLTIMNMLIGILCEVVSSAAESENAAVFEQDLTVFVDKLARETDTDGSNSIDKSEFDDMIKNPELVEHLHDLGLDVDGIIHRAPLVFSEHPELTYYEFAHFMSQFRGSQPSKVKDVMDVTKHLAYEISQLEKAFDKLLASLGEKIDSRISGMTKPSSQ